MPKKAIKKKHYSVRVVAFATVLVIDAESEDKALEYAQNELSFGDLQMDEMRIEREVKPEELENARRHADAVAEDV